jgi:signal peptidase I
MEPALRVGERAFADMQAYDAQAPARGDIVVFTLPSDGSPTYVKRIIGLPGEKVQMKGGIVQINGRAVPTVDAGTYKLALPGEPEKQVPLKRETLPNGVSVTTLDLLSNGFYDNTSVYQVPAGQYFVLGDNRDNSTDSRVLDKFGYIPRANVIGRITLIFWSSDFSRIGTMPK